MEELYTIIEFYQTAGVFGPPNGNDWDGFFRFNPSKNGGIVCIFRNDNSDEKRNIKVPLCKENKSYEIVSGETDKSLGKISEIELKTNGFEIFISEKNKAVALEIKEVN